MGPSYVYMEMEGIMRKILEHVNSAIPLFLPSLYFQSFFFFLDESLEHDFSSSPFSIFFIFWPFKNLLSMASFLVVFFFPFNIYLFDSFSALTNILSVKTCLSHVGFGIQKKVPVLPNH